MQCDTVKTIDENDLLPFRIAFDKRGKPHLLDRENRPIPPKDIEFPIETKAIRSLETFTICQYAGSNYYLVKIGGYYYLVEML